MAVFLFSIMLCVVPIDRGCSFLLKVRWTIYFSWWRCYGCVFVYYYAVWRSDKRVGVLFYLRSDRHYILVSAAILAVFFLIIILCDVLIDSGRSFLLKVRWTIYITWWHSHGCVCCPLLYCVMFWYTMGVFFFLRSDIKYILVSDTNMAVYLLMFMLCDVLIDNGRSFLVKVRWTIYFTWWHCHGCVVFLIIILCSVLIDSGRSFLRKVRWTIYFS